MLAVKNFDWVRVDSTKRAYQLYTGQSKLTSLIWQNIDTARAIAHSQTSSFLYACIGYLTRHVNVKCLTTNETIATFVPFTRGGLLRFRDNQTYTLRSAYPMHPEMEWENSLGEKMIHFKGVFAADGRSGHGEIICRQPDHLSAEHHLLLSLGWYLLVTSYLDMALII
ncbi:MAG: hypothetical protein U0694_20980 [Anaerolineae bacterium]